MDRLPPVVVNDQAGRLVAAGSNGRGGNGGNGGGRDGGGRAGGNGGDSEVDDWLTQLARRTRVIRADAGDCTAAIEELLADGHERIAVGGGDGTLRSTAELIERAKRNAEVVFLPLGTHNHFAKDLGVPLEVSAWSELLESPVTTRIDLGEVNGHLFLNNVSIGLYPAIVQQRQKLPKERIAGSKRLATLWAGYRTWRSLPRPFEVRWQKDDEGSQRRRTRLLLVSNNQYADEPLAPLTREELQGGRLTLYAPRTLRLGGAASMAWYALRGEVALCPHLEVVRAERFSLALDGKRLEVALDGELLETELPLEVRVRKRALTVVLPEVGLKSE